MRLSEALAIARRPPSEAETAAGIFLACGFTPLHVETFTAAMLRAGNPSLRPQFETGLYGDFAGALGRLAESAADYGIVIVEWADLDARLGMRGLGGWRTGAADDILGQARSRIALLSATVESVAKRMRLAICLPTLPLPPIETSTPDWSTGSLRVRLRELIASFASFALEKGAKLVDPDWLDRMSPSGSRFDAKSELLNGFPYTLEHAAAVAEGVTLLLRPPAPKKGLITDLDNTMWKGIVGDAGVDGVAWDLDRKAHAHGVYQEFLRSLAESGVLIAVASKNDPAIVEETFARRDMLISRDRIFPWEVHWNRKSDSVSRILEIWNVGPDSVVFIDDSPAEVAEVQAVHPAIECVRFPESPRDLWPTLERLRTLFAKPAVTEEDRIRLDSIRAGYTARPEAVSGNSDGFLEGCEAEITFTFEAAPVTPRVVELLNKTNQFNLNGRRTTEAELARYLAAPQAFVLKAAYTDKFGPLGTIAVLMGRAAGGRLHIDAWVMSCRAFSRRIEHACLNHLFRRFDAVEAEFEFAPTERNGPLRRFFAELLEAEPGAPFRLSKRAFDEKCPRLFHRVQEEGYG